MSSKTIKELQKEINDLKLRVEDIEETKPKYTYWTADEVHSYFVDKFKELEEDIDSLNSYINEQEEIIKDLANFISETFGINVTCVYDHNERSRIIERINKLMEL